MSERMGKSRKPLSEALKAAYETLRTGGGRYHDFPPSEILPRAADSVTQSAEAAAKAAGPAILATTLAASAPATALAAESRPPIVDAQKRAVGELALNSLMEDLSALDPSQGMQEGILNAADIACLARNAFNEARGERFEGQLATALVALARAKDKRFSNSVCGVIYQPYQFSWTHDMQILMAQARHAKNIEPLRDKFMAMLDGQPIEHAIALIASLLKLPEGTLYYKRTDWNEHDNIPGSRKETRMSERSKEMWRKLIPVPRGPIGNHTFYTDPPGKARPRR